MGHVHAMPTLVFLISLIIGGCVGQVRTMPTLVFIISLIFLYRQINIKIEQFKSSNFRKSSYIATLA